MDDDVLTRNWDHLRHKVHAQWSKLTPDELDQIGGDRALLVARVSDKYGLRPRDVELQLDAVTRGYAAGDEPA